MCGIAGLLNLGGEALQDSSIAARMAGLLAHRGPDDQGFMHTGPIAFGFRRLSIIDLDGGHQPVANETQTIWAMVNGEIYNFIELRNDLSQRGHIFQTQSDTEVVVHAYETYGLEFVQKLRGMFAIALWDGDKRRVILVRDRIGKKPLFWSAHGQQLAFASEMKALLAWPGLDRTLDREAIHDYLSFLTVPAPKSIFRAVRKLEPAQMLIADAHNGSIQLRRYWHLQQQPDYGKPRHYFVEGLRERLEDSVRLRLRSDVPLGALLSGGLDSSGVVGLMAREQTAGAVRTFSLGFEDATFDETYYARLAARAFRTEHVQETVKPIGVDLLERIAWFLDEPFADSSAIPTYEVSRIARQYVTVALSGDGGDELFGGYPRYRYARWLSYLARIPGTMRDCLNVFARCAGSALNGRQHEILRRFSKAVDLSRLPEPQRRMALLSYYDEADKRNLYTSEFAQTLDGYSSLNRFPSGPSHAGDDVVAAFMSHDLQTNLADDSLVKVDRMSMACSLEVRCPLLDYKLVEFAATIPVAFKLRGTDTKMVFKEALADVLPAEIINRGKWGFAVPFGYWFGSGEWRALLDDCLSTEAALRRGIFDPAVVNQLRRAILSNRGSRELGISTHQMWHRVWILLMFELWARQYLDPCTIASHRTSSTTN